MKNCKRCKQEKNESEYYKNHDECKLCWREYCSIKLKERIEKDPTLLISKRNKTNAWRKANKEKIKSYNEKYRENNKEKLKLYSKKYRANNKIILEEKRKSPEGRAKMNEAVKDWRKRNSERFKETEKLRKARSRKKTNAVTLIAKHLRRGKLEREKICSKCGVEGFMEAHHPDYEKPNEVIFLCFLCHKQEHGKLLDVNP